MRIIKKAGTALLPLTITLSGCSGSGSATDNGQTRPQAAEQSIFVDGSASTPFIASPAYADAAVRRAGQDVMRQKLGDSVRIVSFGNRSADNAVDVLSVKSGYKLHLPTVRKRVESALQDLMTRNRETGGQGSTNLTYSLENAAIRCTPRSHLVILSDGIAEDGTYSAARALAEGKAVHLPSPATPYLQGCTVEVLGVGMSPTGAGQGAQTLPNDQVQRLIAGLREYFSAAGVRPEDMTFASVL